MAQTAWTGAANDEDWLTAGNWSAGLPTSGTNATVATKSTLTGIAEVGELIVGSPTPSANLTISEGGSLTATGNLFLAKTADQQAVMTITGTGSLVAIPFSYSLYVGNLGSGRLVIENGGKLTASDSDIGNGAIGIGSVVVTGTDSLWSSDEIRIGALGTGGVVVRDGASVTGWSTTIGMSNGNGTVTLTGAGSKLEAQSFVALGNRSTGTLNIGSAEGEAAAAAGTLTAPKLSLVSDPYGFGMPGGSSTGSATLVFNHTGANYEFGTKMEGGANANTSTIKHIAGTTNLTADNYNYTGTT